MKIKHSNQIGKIAVGQDGAIYGGFLFRFDTKGTCYVYDLAEMKAAPLTEEAFPEYAKFTLDKADVLAPHSNAVMFGSEKFDERDEFPLLYSNVYNAFQDEEDKHEGECLVYRIQRNGKEFTTKMLQIIKVGFTDDRTLWRSPEGEEKRPYGNFTIDQEKGILYAFSMLYVARLERYFAFRLPKWNEGEKDPVYGVNKVILQKEDILEQFDTEYHHFVQGACFHDGLIYSAEGFTNRPLNPPGLRVIDPAKKEQIGMVHLEEYDLMFEPELIDFWNEDCIFADCKGNTYHLEFEF